MNLPLQPSQRRKRLPLRDSVGPDRRRLQRQNPVLQRNLVLR